MPSQHALKPMRQDSEPSKGFLSRAFGVLGIITSLDKLLKISRQLVMNNQD